MTPAAYSAGYVLPILEKAIAERNDASGKGGAAKIARELGCTESLISQLRKGTYSNPARRYRQIVEKYAGETVDCPVVGVIGLERCRIECEKPYSTTNPTRRAFSQTCPECAVRRD